MTDVPLGLAFFFGLISFLSPCVLPLVPGYISCSPESVWSNFVKVSSLNPDCSFPL